MAKILIEILVYYVFILSSIVLFTAPFYLLYKKRIIKNRDSEHPKKDSLNLSLELEHFFSSKEANWLIFSWAMGEALVWFVIPEFLLLLVVFMRIRKKKALLTYDIAGTVAGTAIAFMIHLPNDSIAKLPFVRPAMVDQAIAWFEQLGIWGLIYQPFSGVPYKVFTLTATQFGFSFVVFVMFAVVVRMSRYSIFFGIFLLLYPGLHKIVYKNYFKLFLVVVLIFTVLLLKVVHRFS